MSFRISAVVKAARLPAAADKRRTVCRAFEEYPLPPLHEAAAKTETWVLHHNNYNYKLNYLKQKGNRLKSQRDGQCT